MRSIFLIRHGATDWSGIRYCGRTDVPLSSGGAQQAQAIAAYLAQKGADKCVIVSSPLQRASATAAALHDTLGGPTIFDADLCEVDFGDAEGATFIDLERWWPDLAQSLRAGNLAIDWPCGESWAHLERRVTAAWDRLAQSQGDIAVITHGGPARLLANLALGEAVPHVLQPGQLWVLVGDVRWQITEVWPQ